MSSLPETVEAADAWIDMLQRIDRLEHTLRTQTESKTDALNLLVFSGERDRLLAAFTLANSAAACGMDVNMFFAFWGTSVLRDHRRKPTPGKSLVERAFGWLLPRGLQGTKLSTLDFWGAGRLLMTREMRKKSIAGLDELLESAIALGVKIQVCEMSMKLMGIRQEELIAYPRLSICGAAHFLDTASRSNITLFV